MSPKSNVRPYTELLELPSLKAVCFDMDGVLIDSVPAQVEAFYRFLRPHGVEFKKEALARFNGPTHRQILEMLKDDYSLNFEIAAAEAQIAKFLEEIASQPFPTATQVVNAFRWRGYKIGLASSSPRARIEKLCKEWHFDAVVSGDDVMKSKPNPEIFNRLAEELKVAPQECAAVEDSPLGIQAAKAAGMYTVGVATTERKSALRSDNVVDRLEQILEIPQLFAHNILFACRPMDLSQIDLEVNAKKAPLSKLLEREINAHWTDISSRNPRLENRTVANLRHFKEENGKVYLAADFTDYKTYRGLANRNDYDIFDHGICILGVSALLITSDQKVLWARRGLGLIGESMWHNIPGGVLNATESGHADLRESILKELREEVHLGPDAVTRIRFIGIGHDNLSKGAELLFEMVVNVSSEKLLAIQSSAEDGYETQNVTCIPIKSLQEFANQSDVMPASRALVNRYLEITKTQ